LSAVVSPDATASTKEFAMPTRTSAALGAPTWIDLSTSDPEGARSFYGQLFGWTADAPNPEFGGYFMFNHAGAPVAGCMDSGAGGAPDAERTEAWSVYLASDDIEKTLAAVTAEGGTVVVPAMPVGGAGTMAYVTDPGGAGIGVWQPDEFIGFTTYAETGAPGWWELLTKEYAKAIPFYRDVFHWDTATMGDSDAFRYTVQMVGELQSAGVMDASTWLGGTPSHWSVYFAVDDADAALDRAVELGGSVQAPAQDTPYGRLATAADPTGAQFKLLGPNRG
jgi:predicted enzyme related to lactoylglutathione lyase